MALYGHSIFAQTADWGIDTFDQWGSEPGKVPAQRSATTVRPTRSSGATVG
ncbi:MAG: hypothetical protein KF753_15240 [Caldilineaceae bacterium]|nr:hypothetical protein [Caldilineaceae bacterium]